MALTYSEGLDTSKVAPSFKLQGVDQKKYALEDFSEFKAVVVVFMCNHCPYVIAVQDRINQLAKDYQKKGVQVIGINSNDTERYPEDSFEKMKERSQERSFVFPYLIDETQEVARSYGAVCTPDPMVFENVEGKFILRYHGRIDDSWKDESKVTRKDLAEALEAILGGNSVSPEQHPAMGCSIKWKQ